MDKQYRALVVREKDGKPQLVSESISAQQPGPHQVALKVSYVAQNPTDVQSFDSNAFGDGAVLGCDFVGEVIALGPDVTRYAVGDTIAGLIWGGETPGLGAYSQFLLADEDIGFKVPDAIKYAEAATVPLASATAWLALFGKDSLNIDRSKGKDVSVLIWGGSSSVGLYAIQIAALQGFKIVTTCSTKNFDLVRRYGAHEVFDYRDDNVASKIKDAVPGLKYVFDTIGSTDSSALASQALDAEGGILCTVRPGKEHTDNVAKNTVVKDVLVFTAFLKDHQYKTTKYPASKEDHKLASELFDSLPTLLEEGQIKPNEPKVLEGLESVPEGFQQYRDGKISAFKFVYKI